MLSILRSTSSSRCCSVSFMPRPLSHVTKATGYIVGLGNLVNARPLLAQSMMNVISSWAFAEAEIGASLVDILKNDARGVIDEFINLRSLPRQKDLLLEHGAKHLHSDDLEILQALLMMLSSGQRERNRLVHGLSGFSISVPECVVIVDTRKRLSMLVDMRDNDLSKELDAKPIAYFQSDFDRMYELASNICRGFTLFKVILHHPTKRAQLLERLREMPQFRIAMSRIQADH